MHPPAFAGLLVALALACASAPAHAVHKCQDGKGRTVFSDLPCQMNETDAGAAGASAAPGTASQGEPVARPIALPVLTAGQGSPRELVTALYRCLEAASVASQKQFLSCSHPGGSAHQQATEHWSDLLASWRSALPRRLLATAGTLDPAERFGSINLVSGEVDQINQRLSASFARQQGLWKLVQLQLPKTSGQ